MAEKLDHTGNPILTLSQSFEGNMADSDLECAMDSVDQAGTTLTALLGAIEKTVPHVSFSREYSRRLTAILTQLNLVNQQITQLKGLNARAMDGELDELDPQVCPGCFCTPGDGVTDGCVHPDGCGYVRAIGHDSTGTEEPKPAKVISLFRSTG